MDASMTPGRRWRAVRSPFAVLLPPLRARCVSMLMPYDETDPRIPTIGSPLSCPVDGGQDWFTFGTIIGTRLLDGFVEIVVAVDDKLLGPTTEET